MNKNNHDMNNTEFDAIIVGGGTNGLSAGCYLGMEGKRVLVLEALDKVGGMASSGYLIPEAPQHLVHPCAMDMMSMRVHAHVPRELELERHGFKSIELSPGYVYLHPDGTSLVFWRDRQQTAAEIRRYSPRDAEAFLEFMKVIDLFLDIALPMMRVDPARTNLMTKLKLVGTALKRRKLKPELMALMTGSAHQAARERFEHPVTISAMCALTGLAGDISADGGGIYYALLGFLHRFGVGRVIGGMQQLSNAMRARLEELGGQVMTSARVEEILASQGKVRGVRLADGREFTARAVIAGCHPKVALEMVSAGEMPSNLLTRIAMAPANANVEGIQGHVIGRWIEAAPDFTARLNTVNGCVVHIDTTSMRSSAMRPAYGLGGDTLPVEGLYLGSAGIHPGGGVNGMAGRLAAGRVKRYLAKAGK